MLDCGHKIALPTRINRVQQGCSWALLISLADMLSCEMGGGIFLPLHLYVMGAIHFYHFTFVNPAYKDTIKRVKYKRKAGFSFYFRARVSSMKSKIAKLCGHHIHVLCKIVVIMCSLICTHSQMSFLRHPPMPLFPAWQFPYKNWQRRKGRH